jgi:cation-transporting P-type ATPase 13A2
MKGSLIKSILYPKPNRFSFHADSMKFIGVLAFLAVLGFLATIKSTIEYSSTRRTIIKALSLVTITVPPALPAAMSIGIVFALARLRRNKIYCIAPQRINVAGRVKTIVFDKTGTLTEDSLKFSGVTVALKDTFSDLETDIESFQESIANDSNDPHLQEIKQK